MVRKKPGLKGREFLKLFPDKERMQMGATLKLLPKNERARILAMDLSKEPFRFALASPETIREFAKLLPADLNKITETDTSKGPVKLKVKSKYRTPRRCR